MKMIDTVATDGMELPSAPYRAALYARLSKEDAAAGRGLKSESNSIRNQKQLMLDYAERQADIQVVSIREDDGYTGTDYDRPEFQHMMEDIKAGSVNCVIVKDDCVIIERKHRKPQKMRVLWCPFCFLTQNRG